MAITALIVDDEPLARKRMRKLLRPGRRVSRFPSPRLRGEGGPDEVRGRVRGLVCGQELFMIKY
jgi:hypothetical protein